jgi:hypothetical protein
MFVQSTKKCDWEEYWEQEKVEARLKEKGWRLDSYIRNHKKKAREMAKFICESRARNPDKFGDNRREHIWKKIDDQDEALKRMYALVEDLLKTDDKI